MSPAPVARRSSLVLAISLFVALLWPVVAFAADGDEPERPPPKLSVQDVTVNKDGKVRVRVTAPGNFVEDVPAEAFAVTEDGQPRDAEVKRINSDNLEVVLALDNSGSVAAEPLKAAKSAALAFVKTMPPHVRVGVVSFNTRAKPLTKLTAQRGPVRRAIRSLQSGGRTALFDAVETSVTAFDWSDDARRVIVIMADGEDNQSAATLADTVALVRKHDAALHVVQLATEFSEAKPLEKLADTGKGAVVSIDDSGGLDAVYGQIAADLVNQYELTYSSQARGNALVKVRVNHDGVAAGGSRRVDVMPAAGGGWLTGLFESDWWTRPWVLYAGAALWFVLFVLFATSSARGFDAGASSSQRPWRR